MKLAGLALLFSCVIPVAAHAERLSSGTYAQTGSNAGQCAACTVAFKQLVGDLYAVAASNGWSGIAMYHGSNDTLEGYNQYEKGQGGAYDGPPMDTVWIYRGGVLEMTTYGKAGTITATYKKAQ